jgi:hypothetical protein
MVRPNPKLFCVSDDANSIQGVRPNPKLSCVSDDANSIRLSLLLGLAPWKRKSTSTGATLAYVKLTMNCVECHKLAREQRLISLAPREPDRGRR